MLVTELVGQEAGVRRAIKKLGATQGLSEAKGENVCAPVSARACLEGVRGRDLRGPGAGSSTLRLRDTAVPGRVRNVRGSSAPSKGRTVLQLFFLQKPQMDKRVTGKA